MLDNQPITLLSQCYQIFVPKEGDCCDALRLYMTVELFEDFPSLGLLVKSGSLLFVVVDLVLSSSLRLCIGFLARRFKRLIARGQ